MGKILKGDDVWYSEFKQIITNNKGIISSRALTEQYFRKLGKLDLWETFVANTNHLNDYTNTQKIKFLDLGHFTEIPKCYCGKDVSIIQREVSSYCSTKCHLSSPERRAKLKDSMTKIDKASANSKRESTMMTKYGAKFNSQRTDIHHVWEKSKLTAEIEDKLNDKEWMSKEYNTNGRSASDIANQLGCFYGTVLDYCRKHEFKIRQRTNFSKEESQLQSWLNSIGVECVMGDTTILDGKEIDCYLPDYNLGIEIDGLYWHKEDKKPQSYHLDKTIKAENSGCKLLHFTDHEWNEKKEIVQSIIKTKIGLSDVKLFARKCEIKQITNSVSNKFLDEHHMQGGINAKFCYGLFFGQELVMMLSLTNSRFDSTYDWELLRLCSKKNTVVVGGFSKLIKFVRSAHSGTIVSYCDRRYSYGSGYLTVGFKLVRTTEPGFFWTNGTEQISRFKCQKKQLKKWMANYDDKVSQTENMKSIGFVKFWDCGNFVFVM